MSIDSPADLVRMRESSGAQFEFLSDPEGKLLDPLYIRHTGGRFDGVDLAQSASFLISSDGVVLWQKVTDNYRLRPSADEVLGAIDRALPAV